MKLHVQSLPIKDVLNDLSEATGGKLVGDANYHELYLPATIGEGIIAGIDFGHGFGMINYRCTFFQDTQIAFDLGIVHPLKFLYAYQGTFEHRFAIEDNCRRVHTYQNLGVASRHDNGHVLRFEANKPLLLYSVEIDRATFCHRFREKFGESESEFQQLLLDTEAQKQFHYEGNYALSISDSIAEVFKFKGEGVLRCLFYEGKSYDILVAQWLQYVDDLKGNGGSSLKQRTTAEAIKETITFLRTRLKDDLTVSTLANRARLSEEELQKGFRKFTGMTVNQYVREARLCKAMDLLKSGEFNVSEALDHVGFSSISYFSRKFKERWGIPPSSLLRPLVDDR